MKHSTEEQLLSKDLIRRIYLLITEGKAIAGKHSLPITSKSSRSLQVLHYGF